MLLKNLSISLLKRCSNHSIFTLVDSKGNRIKSYDIKYFSETNDLSPLHEYQNSNGDVYRFFPANVTKISDNCLYCGIPNVNERSEPLVLPILIEYDTELQIDRLDFRHSKVPKLIDGKIIRHNESSFSAARYLYATKIGFTTNLAEAVTFNNCDESSVLDDIALRIHGIGSEFQTTITPKQETIPRFDTFSLERSMELIRSNLGYGIRDCIKAYNEFANREYKTHDICSFLTMPLFKKVLIEIGEPALHKYIIAVDSTELNHYSNGGSGFRTSYKVKYNLDVVSQLILFDLCSFMISMHSNITFKQKKSFITFTLHGEKNIHWDMPYDLYITLMSIILYQHGVKDMTNFNRKLKGLPNIELNVYNDFMNLMQTKNTNS